MASYLIFPSMFLLYPVMSLSSRRLQRVLQIAEGSMSLPVLKKVPKVINTTVRCCRIFFPLYGIRLVLSVYSFSLRSPRFRQRLFNLKFVSACNYIAASLFLFIVKTRKNILREIILAVYGRRFFIFSFSKIGIKFFYWWHQGARGSKRKEITF